jgi:hypothetical protein
MENPDVAEVNDPPDEAPDEPSAPDFLLAALVRNLNEGRDSNASFGVTLLVHGAVLTGELVGGGAYFEWMADVFDASVREATGEEPSPKSLAAYVRNVGSSDYGEDADTGTLTYLHLRNAQVYQSGFGAAVPTPGTWWRGRLTSVDGWMLGILKRADDVSAEPDA